MNNTPSAYIQVIGHDWAVDLLKRQATAGRMPHALLLTGPRNVGKSTLAHFLAQYLNCQAETKPCGACLACRKLVSGNHPDVRIWDDDDEAIKIEQIRELQRELALSPYEGQYRVALLCNFERATISAANALLKTLEEPASPVVIVLTAADPGGLLPTIVSRCQVLTLRPLSRPIVIEALQQRWEAAPAQAELLAQLAAGRLGWAVKALTDTTLLTRREGHLTDLLAVLSQNRVQRLAYAYELSQNPATLRETLTAWLTIWRDLLLLHSGSHIKILNLDWQDRLHTLAGQTNLGQAQEMVAKLRAALTNLDYNVNSRLNLESVLLKMPKLSVMSVE